MKNFLENRKNLIIFSLSIILILGVFTYFDYQRFECSDYRYSVLKSFIFLVISICLFYIFSNNLAAKIAKQNIQKDNIHRQEIKNQLKEIEQIVKVNSYNSNYKMLSYTSHNIKNAILNMEWRLNELIEKEELKDEIIILQEDLQKIRISVNEFNQMNQLHDKTEFKIKEVFEYFEKLFGQDLKREKINFTVNYNSNEEFVVNQEFNFIFQIINNLVTNSIKALLKSENKQINVQINIALRSNLKHGYKFEHRPSIPYQNYRQ